jgi:hypothetical protein
MGRSVWQIIALSSLALAGMAVGPAQAADSVKPGNWEFNAQMEMTPPPGEKPPPGVQPRLGGVGVKHTGCIEPDKAVPIDPRPECKIDRMTRNGGTVSWATTCTTPRGPVRSEGVAHYAGDTMEAALTTRIPQPGAAAIETRQRITGRYLGPCTK